MRTSSMGPQIGGSPRPSVSPDQAAQIASDHFGLSGQMRDLGSNQDHNFLFAAPGGAVVLKVANPAWERESLEAQHAALSVVSAAGIIAPTVVEPVTPVRIGDQTLLSHVLSFVPGTPLIDGGSFGVEECRRLGDVAGRVVVALSAFTHPGAERQSEWDLRLATEVVARFSPETMPALGDAIARLEAVSAHLPTQVIHGDITDDNVVLTPSGEIAVIDFGDLGVSWRCAELAVAATSVLGKTADDVGAVLAVVESFTHHVELSDTELTAVWPLVVLRGAALVASAAGLTAADVDNHYANERSDAEVAAFQIALGLDAEEMSWLVRGVGQALPSPRLAAVLPSAVPVPLDVTSPRWDEGAWLDGAATDAGGNGVVATRYGEYRLDHAQPLTARGTGKVFALGVDVSLPVGTVLPDLPAGVAVTGVDEHGVTVEPSVHVQVCTLPGVPPRFVTPRAEEVWRRICPDPSPLFGCDLAAPVPEPARLLARRDEHFATVQEHYFAEPPQIERGWREFLIDTRANVYVDVVNNVATTGHGHPALTTAAARQWSLLNTNSRFLYETTVAYSERLAALAPDGLDQVFLVNSGSEAVDLALRLAMTATGRHRILAAREAYHGWTLGSDAVTTSLNDNPRAADTRPAWVELLDAPNALRGTHRGPDAGIGYLADLDAQLAGLDTAQIAGVILEPIFGNGGGVLLPEGYLAGVFDRVRALGGVCISDEVQVGFGRLGHHFWGFEQQGAVPDIITVAKSIGNGQPLGAVITTRAIAEAFAAEGSFFSSAGGSPVSSAIGMAVLDVMQTEQLQLNARTVGDHFKAGLERLAQSHPVIGAVHGMGLYLGVELVSDRETFAPAQDLAVAVCDAMLEEGCIVQPTGDHGNVLKIKPPLVITTESVDFVLAGLDRVLTRLGV